MKIKKGDTVKILTGKDRGKQGRVDRVWPKEEKVLVGGINMYKKHIKRQADKPGEIVSLARPLVVGKVAVICPKCKQATRIGYQNVAGKKVRVCRKCDATI